MNATTNYYGMFSEAGNSAVDAIVEAVKKIAKAKKDTQRCCILSCSFAYVRIS